MRCAPALCSAVRGWPARAPLVFFLVRALCGAPSPVTHSSFGAAAAPELEQAMRAGPPRTQGPVVPEHCRGRARAVETFL